MHCKRCGKALGTDRGICPFCGAMLSNDQMKVYQKEMQDRNKETRLITEKYGEKPYIYEKAKNSDNKLAMLLMALFLVVIVLIIVLIFTMK